MKTYDWKKRYVDKSTIIIPKHFIYNATGHVELSEWFRNMVVARVGIPDTILRRG